MARVNFIYLVSHPMIKRYSLIMIGSLDKATSKVKLLGRPII